MGNFYRRGGKRIVDVAGACGVLLVTAPILLAAAVAVRRSLGPPVIFRQDRPGRDAKLFTLLKLRTMREASDASGIELPDSDRLTPLGRFLRSTSIDELPALVNVLRGDLSLVGPRPLLTEYLPRYSAVQARRHDVQPGITGLAQVSGRNEMSWEDKFALDVWYVDHVSMRLDAWIIWRTIRAVVRREGIVAKGHATAPRFNPDRSPTTDPSPAARPLAANESDDAENHRVG